MVTASECGGRRPRPVLGTSRLRAIHSMTTSHIAGNRIQAETSCVLRHFGLLLRNWEVHTPDLFPDQVWPNMGSLESGVWSLTLQHPDGIWHPTRPLCHIWHLVLTSYTRPDTSPALPKAFLVIPHHELHVSQEEAPPGPWWPTGSRSWKVSQVSATQHYTLFHTRLAETGYATLVILGNISR